MNLDNPRYEKLKDVVLNIDEVKIALRLPKGGLYCSLLDLHKRLNNINETTVDKIIKCAEWGRRDISFTKNLYDLAETKIK